MRIGWREQLHFVAAELNAAGGINPTWSRQERRHTMRRIAKLECGELYRKGRKNMTREQRERETNPKQIRLVYPDYTKPNYGGLFIRQANARNGVGRWKAKPPRNGSATAGSGSPLATAATPT